ncbi:MAG: polysaccharide export protein [Alphaproteobacteria bacterium]|jgi:protein involved in polysaccharide export with SLBB domain|nr:polysaccharide export protein [Alphaproteobacteria bacterium]
MKHLRSLICALAMIAFLMAAAPSVRAAGEHGALGPDDVLEIVVYGEKDLSGSYRIGPDGAIAMPLIGEVNVGGMTARAAEKSIETKLADGYLVEPSVTMQVKSSRPFYIMGEVKNPGSYAYASNMTVLNAVALAGGFTYRAAEGSVEVTRGGAERQISPEEKIAPGDVITVNERFF